MTLVSYRNINRKALKFNKGHFCREDRYLPKWKLKWDYPRERIKSFKDLTTEQMSYFSEKIIRGTQQTEDQKKICDDIVVKSVSPTDKAMPDQVVIHHSRKIVKSSARIHTICANHTSIIYDYKKANDTQETRIAKFRSMLKSSWLRIL